MFIQLHNPKPGTVSHVLQMQIPRAYMRAYDRLDHFENQGSLEEVEREQRKYARVRDRVCIELVIKMRRESATTLRAPRSQNRLISRAPIRIRRVQRQSGKSSTADPDSDGDSAAPLPINLCPSKCFHLPCVCAFEFEYPSVDGGAQ